MQFLFALLAHTATFSPSFSADTATDGGWNPPAAPDAPADNGSPETTPAPDQGGVQAAPAAEQTGAAQEAPEAPIQDGAQVHESAPLTDEEKAKAAADANALAGQQKSLVMPPDVRAAFVGLITETLEKIEAKKLEEAAASAQAQPHGGIGSEAAKVEAKFHSVTLGGDKREMVQRINDAAKALALAVEEFVPAGKEKDFAHAAIMQAAMFSNSAISRS